MVSVVIPAYQAESFILKALNSVYRQTYRPIEVIVINDGSKDKLENTINIFCDQSKLNFQDNSIEGIEKISKSWCACSADTDFSLLYVEKQNGGPSSARNVGLTVAGGEYIAFLDADDQWYPEKLEKQINHLVKNKADVVFTDISIEKNNELYVDSVAKRHKWDIPETSDEKLFWFKKLLEYNFIITSTLLIKKKCISEIDWFDESINHGEDYDFFLRLAIYCKFTYYQEVTCKKFIHENNLSNDEIKFYDNKIYILKKVFMKYKDVLSKNTISYYDHLSKTYKNYAYYCYLNKQYYNMLKKYTYHFYYVFHSR